GEDFARRGLERARGLPQLRDNARQPFERAVEGLAQFFVLAGIGLGDAARQVSLGHLGEAALQLFDHGLRAPALRDVGAQLHDLEDPALVVEDRVVRSLNPNLAAAPAEPPELPRNNLAGPEPPPEIGVPGALRHAGLDEHPMTLSDDLVEAITHRGEEILVGIENRAVEPELDHRL